MEVSQVIKMRNTLKCGKNLPLRVFMNNNHRTVDESSVLEFVKWDDSNGFLYVYHISDMQNMSNPSNNGGELTLFCVSYEDIQAMEIAGFPLSLLSDTLDSLAANGAEIKEPYRQGIIDMFNKALDKNLVYMTHTDINKMMGLRDGNKALNDNEDYYEGKFTQNFAETLRPNQYNKQINSTNISDDDKN